MKQGSFRAVCLALLAAMAAGAAFGDDVTVNSASIVLESFDGDSPYAWKVQGSKFATKIDDDAWPQSSIVASWPRAINRTFSGEENKGSLGVWGKFDRQGSNWIDIYPSSAEGGDDAGPAEIPIRGRLQYVDAWVWGSNLDYTLEAYFRDSQGFVHVVSLGRLKVQGWKNLQVRIPSSIPQKTRAFSKLAFPREESYLTFVKFRVWTLPTAPVADFRVYFDQLKILTDTFDSIYDGDELALPERIEELWNAGK
jgi:hypothetical protein